MDQIDFPVTLQPATFETLCAYLRKRPWEEVHPLIVSLAAAAQASAPKPAEDKKGRAKP